MKRLSVVALALVMCAPLGCADELPPESEGQQIEISVAPLTLPGVTQAYYTLEVQNAAEETVWSRDIDSQSFGDGAGSVSYIGPCDADSNDNKIFLTLTGLEANGVELDAATYENPGTLEREFECLENQDVRVSFDITILRQANQGFFDVAVEFDQIFCSAKVDCKQDNDVDEISLLFNDGVRDTTIVTGFACTSGRVGEDTSLYRDNLVLTCGNGTAVIDPRADGNIDYTNNIEQAAGDQVLFGAAVYRGEEQFSFDKLYWNVLLGLEDGMVDCVLESNATAAHDYLELMTTPLGNSYPYVHWEVNITDASGALICTQHPVNGADPNDGVTTDYVTSGTKTFDRLYSPEGVPLQGAGLPGAPYRWADGSGAATCLDFLNTSDPLYILPGAFEDGWYWLDPDGDGTGAEYLCDMTNEGGGWTFVVGEDFESGTTTGWSWHNVVSSCGAFGNIMWDSVNYAPNNGGYTEKVFSWAATSPAFPHTEARLKLDYIKIDSWDTNPPSGDTGYVDFTRVEDSPTGVNFTSFTFTSGEGTQECGAGDAGWNEAAHPVTMVIAHDVADSADQARVRGSSSLDSPGGDESWGLDNIEIWLR